MLTRSVGVNHTARLRGALAPAYRGTVCGMRNAECGRDSNVESTVVREVGEKAELRIKNSRDNLASSGLRYETSKRWLIVNPKWGGNVQ